MMVRVLILSSHGTGACHFGNRKTSQVPSQVITEVTALELRGPPGPSTEPDNTGWGHQVGRNQPPINYSNLITKTRPFLIKTKKAV